MTIRSPRAFMRARSGARTFLDVAFITLSSSLEGALRLFPRPAIAGACTQAQQSDELLVLFLRKLIQGAVSGFGENAFGDRPLQFRSNFRRPKRLDHAGERVHQVFHEVLDPA